MSIVNFFSYVSNEILALKPGDRKLILIPRELSHLGWDVDWDMIEEILMAFRGSVLKDNVFVTLRFNQDKPLDDFFVDIVHV